MSAHQVVRVSWRWRSCWRREKVCRQGCGRAGRRRCWASAVRAAIAEDARLGKGEMPAPLRRRALGGAEALRPTGNEDEIIRGRAR